MKTITLTQILRAHLPSARGNWPLIFGVLPFSFCLAVNAQSYSIDWSTVDGGGGTSTGGVYTVTGTIGQPDAGMLSGGPYTLTGGFWSVIAAIQTPDAPYLSVLRTRTNTVVVHWLAPADGWRLTAAADLGTGPGAWMNVPPPYQNLGGTNLSFVEPTPIGCKFYRLVKP